MPDIRFLGVTGFNFELNSWRLCARHPDGVEIGTEGSRVTLNGSSSVTDGYAEEIQNCATAKTDSCVNKRGPDFK